MSFTDHTWVLIQQFREMREVGHFCDIELILDNQIFKAHRSVLAANSPYFRMTLDKDNVTKEKITISDCTNTHALQAVLNFMYSGTLKLNSKIYTDVLQLAKQFQMEKVSCFCETYLLDHIRSSNSLSSLSLATKYNLPKLRVKASKFIDKNMDLVFSESEALQFSFEELECFLKERSLKSNTLLKFICKWVNHAPEKREDLFSDLLTLVKWRYVTPDFLEELKEDTNLLNQTKICTSTLSHFLDTYNFTFKDSSGNFVNIDVRDEPVYKDKNVISRLKRKRPRKSENPQKIFRETLSRACRNASITNEVLLDTDSNTDSNTEDVTYGATEEFSDSSECSLLEEKQNCEISCSSKRKKSCPRLNCSFSTYTEGDFKQHMDLIHASDARYKCQECDFTWVLQTEYAQHLKVHFSGPPYNCSKCKFINNTLSAFTRHFLTHDERTLLECTYCRQSYKNVPSLKQHFRRAHSSQILVSSSDLPTNPNIHKQLIQGAENKTKKCVKCSFSTSIEDDFQIHMDLIHATDKQYKCQECDFRWTWLNDYGKHLKLHFSGPPYYCLNCNFSDNKLKGFVQHILVHQVESLFDCPKCSKSFRNPDSLRKHWIKIHWQRNLAVETKFHSCTKCSFSTLIIDDLENHIALTHSSDVSHKCRDCDFTWTWHVDYANHLTTHFPNAPFDCPECEFSCWQISSLTKHLINHDQYASFECPKCCESFRNPNELERHWRTKHWYKKAAANPIPIESTTLEKSSDHDDRISQSYNCTICSFTSNIKDEFSNHLAVIHATDIKYKCKMCEFMWTWRMDYNTHLKTHFLGPPYHCSECKYVAVTLSKFTLHFVTHSQYPPLACPKCGLFYKTQDGLVAHWKENHWIGQLPNIFEDKRGKVRLQNHKNLRHLMITLHNCIDCDFKGKDSKELCLHMKEHYKSSPFSCNKCEYTTTKMEFFVNHLVSHHKDPQFKCAECNQYFRNITNLKLHVDRLHALTKPYKCDECNKCFGSKQIFNEHKRLYHTKSKVLCDICGHSVKNKNQLWGHKMTKHNTQRFICSHPGCEFKTNFENLLIKHKRYHTGERPFICSFCGRGFISRSCLGKHERIHTRSRIKCSECAVSLSSKKSMKRHMQTFHSKNANPQCKSRQRKSKFQKFYDNEDSVPDRYILPHGNQQMINPTTGQKEAKNYTSDPRCISKNNISPNSDANDLLTSQNTNPWTFILDGMNVTNSLNVHQTPFSTGVLPNPNVAVPVNSHEISSAMGSLMSLY